MNEMENQFVNYALNMIGQRIAIEFAEIINRYPPQLRPVVIAQFEAFTAATRSTFSEEENKLADAINDLSKVVTVVKHKPEEDEE